MFNGVINVYKPKGLTSHDVVSRMRKIADMRRVGHTGTLDPMAEGVLPICLGKSTRIAEYLTGKHKEYLAELEFGKETDTLDAEGDVVRETALPTLTYDEFEILLKSFLGESDQIPPMFSALKKDGKPLYEYARKGEKVDIDSRKIEITKIELIEYNQNRAKFSVECSKGTYIRVLAKDIAEKANSSAFLTYLQRTKSGNFNVEDSVTLDQLREDGVEDYLVSIYDAIPEFHVVKINEKETKKTSCGNSIFLEEYRDKTINNVKVLDQENEIICIGIIENGLLKPKKVFR